jgi:hypothetical protein
MSSVTCRVVLVNERADGGCTEHRRKLGRVSGALVPRFSFRCYLLSVTVVCLALHSNLHRD